MIIPFFVDLNKKMGRNLKTYWRNLTKIFLKIVTENVMLRIYSLPLPFLNCISFLYIEFNYLLYFCNLEYLIHSVTFLGNFH